jgi:hypothetical protein
VAVTTTPAFGQNGGDWTVRADIQGLLSAYSGTTDRDSLTNAGAFLRVEYLERGGFTLGYSRTSLSFVEDGSVDVAQDNIFMSGRWNLTPDWARGRMTLRLDGHFISNDRSSDGTEDVDVIAPQISYLNYAKTFYWDLGFSRSSYGANQTANGLRDVDQLTPTLGFGFNEQRDWVQLRAYLIQADAAQSTQGQGQASRQGYEDTAALELKWTHWPVDGLLGIDNFRLSALFGERRLPVDHDAGSVYNLADLQTGGAAAGAEWAVGERNRILLLAGFEDYDTETSNGTYRNGFMYLNFTHEWD